MKGWKQEWLVLGHKTNRNPFRIWQMHFQVQPNFPTFCSNRELLSLLKAQCCQFLGFLTQFRFKENVGGEIFNSRIWEIWIWNFLYSYFQPGGSSVYFFWDEKHQKHQQRGFKWQQLWQNRTSLLLSYLIFVFFVRQCQRWGLEKYEQVCTFDNKITVLNQHWGGFFLYFGGWIWNWVCVFGIFNKKPFHFPLWEIVRRLVESTLTPLVLNLSYDGCGHQRWVVRHQCHDWNDKSFSKAKFVKAFDKSGG